MKKRIERLCHPDPTTSGTLIGFQRKAHEKED